MRKHRGNALWAVLVVLAGFAVGPLSIARADDPVEQTFFVSPDGTGTDCTSDAPCVLTTAQAEVEALTSTMTGDLIVQLAGGTYSLGSGGLSFGPSDSGQNGFQVSYVAEPGQTPILSGGQTVTGWSLHDAAKNVWQAPVPVGTRSRQLYVNGQRAVLAREDAMTALGQIGKAGKYYEVKKSIAGWPDLTNIDFAFPAAGQNAATLNGTFTDSYCQVASATATTVTMEQPCYANASGNGVIAVPGIGLPTFIENNYNLLSEAGQFYLDSGAGELYYIPRAGESMSTATVVLPTAQSLLTATQVSNMTFSGLTFSYATWLPSASYGVVDTQANVLQTTDYNTAVQMPANVSFIDSTDVTFSNNTLTHLGAAGLSFDSPNAAAPLQGGNNQIVGNVVTDVSGSGITIGDGSTVSEAGSYYAAHAVEETGDTVEDNYVHDVAVEYLGGVGIDAALVSDTTIDHNEVSNVPWCGISLGWGWGKDTETAMSNNHVDDNLVSDAMVSALSDGGPIYINGGMQGATTASTVDGNYVVGDSEVFGSIYLDNGASNVNVNGNVVAHTSTDWIYIQKGTVQAIDNDVEDNYADTTAINSGYSKTNKVTNNQTGLTSWPVAAQAIIANAGVESAYSGILPTVQDRNLAYRTPDTVSSGGSTSAAQANDGNAVTDWASATGDTHAYWETDLGAQYSISRVIVQFRIGTSNATERENLEVRLSNSKLMSGTNYTVACSVGAMPEPYQDTYTCLTPSGPWRYVEVAKTDNKAFTFGEVWVFGH
jgi:hypothetical protein